MKKLPSGLNAIYSARPECNNAFLASMQKMPVGTALIKLPECRNCIPAIARRSIFITQVSGSDVLRIDTGFNLSRTLKPFRNIIITG
jgi:hypothetical protein